MSKKQRAARSASLEAREARPTPSRTSTAAPAKPRGLAELLTPPATPTRWYALLALAFVVWSLGVGARLAWLPAAEANPQAVYDGHVTLTVTDGYGFAAGAKAALADAPSDNRRLPHWSDHALSTFAVLGAQLAPIEEVFVYLPVLVAPLLAVPLLLLGSLLGSLAWGFAAGLLAAIGWSYFNRSLPGYFDTDMFAVTVPLTLVLLQIATVVRSRLSPALAAAALTCVAPFFYDQVGTVLFGLGLAFAAYLLVFHRRAPFTAPALAATALALLPIPALLRLLLLALGALAWRHPRVPRRALPWLAAALGLAALLTNPAVHMVLGQLSQYAERGATTPTGPGDIAFLKVGGLVREMVRLPFPELAERYAGSTSALALAAVGLVLAALRFRALLLLLPLAALAAFAPWGGLRFTIYGVPLAALGLGFLLAHAAALALRVLPRPRLRALLAPVLAAALAAPWVVPQLDDALARTPTTVVQSGEADLMTRLGALAKPGDYAVAWWDFGYPLWYYARLNTLIDGGKHGRDNFIVSQILLTDSQRQAAHLARVAVERYHTQPSSYAPVLRTLFADATAAGRTPRDWLADLTLGTPPPPPPTRGIYLYLPHRMLMLLGAVEQFSRDARQPGQPKAPYLAFGPARTGADGALALQGGLRLDTRAMKLTDRRGQPVPVRAFHLIDSDDGGATHVQSQPSAADARLHVLLFRRYGAALVCDQSVFDSTFVQLYALDRPDPSHFARVLRTPFGAVFKVVP